MLLPFYRQIFNLFVVQFSSFIRTILFTAGEILQHVNILSMSFQIGVYHLIVFETNQFILSRVPQTVPEMPAGSSSSIRRAHPTLPSIFARASSSCIEIDKPSFRERREERGFESMVCPKKERERPGFDPSTLGTV